MDHNLEVGITCGQKKQYILRLHPIARPVILDAKGRCSHLLRTSAFEVGLSVTK